MVGSYGTENSYMKRKINIFAAVECVHGIEQKMCS